MRMATYQQTLRRIQPIVPILFDALQDGLNEGLDEHERKQIRRSGDPHYFAHGVRRVVCERLRDKGLLVTDLEAEKSALAMSGIQVLHNGAFLWVFRSAEQVPLPTSKRKQRFYRQEPTLDGSDNLLLLWHDTDGTLADPMHVIRPLGGDHQRRNLKLDWTGKLSRRMATMRARDLDELHPDHKWTELGSDGQT